MTLPPSRPDVATRSASYAVIRSSSSHRRADDAAAVHGADREPRVEGAEPGEVLQDVGAAEDAVDAGHGEQPDEPVEQGEPVGGAERVAADADLAARGVVGGDDEQPAVRADEVAALALPQRVAQGAWAADAGVEELLVAPAGEPGPVRS